MRGCRQLQQGAIQQVPTGSWTATTCKLASVLSDLGCSTAPQHNQHPLLCPGWKPEAREKPVRHTFRCVVAVSFCRKLPHKKLIRFNMQTGRGTTAAEL
jgi:hypothetical protein